MSEPEIKLTVGGPVQAKAGTYIRRSADDELYDACIAGEFSYVLACRQIGKSSLMNETAQRLTQAGYRVARLDLNRIGQNVTDARVWYFTFLDVLADTLKLNVDVQSWWDDQPPLLNLTQRFLCFLDEIVLGEIAEPIIIFIDEIDVTLGLSFTDDFFAAIRIVHNERAQHPAYNRLTFVLLGVATPTELISDNTRTPFNIGQAISLRDFTTDECAPFRQAVENRHLTCGSDYFGQINHWTSGHPYLTQKLCAAVVKASPDESPELVDTLVKKHFLAEEGRGEDNLQFVQTRVLGDPHRSRMLKIYKRILQHNKGVPNDEQSPAINRLKLYGLVLAENGQLKVRNKIYAQAFDVAWAKAHIPVNIYKNLTIAFGVLIVLLLLFIGGWLVVYPEEFYFYRGLYYENSSDYVSAFNDYSEATKSDYAAAYKARADMRRQIAGRSELEQALRAAIDDYTQAIILGPDNLFFYNNAAAAYNNRGRAYDDLGEHEQAFHDYTTATELDPNLMLAYYNLGTTYYRRDTGDPAEAIRNLSKAIELDPAYRDAYLWRGRAYLDSNNLELAIIDLNRAVELDPKYTLAYLDRGIAYLNSDNLDQAIADFTRAAELEPNNTLALNWLEYAHNKAEGNTDQTTTIELSGTFDYLTYMNRGITYFHSGDLEPIRITQPPGKR